MPTHVVNEPRLFAAGFTLIARNLTTRSESLWRRDDEPERSFTDSEAVAWLATKEKKR